MKHLLFLSLAALCLSCCSGADKAQEIALDNQWKFAVGDNPQWALPDFDDSGWASLSAAFSWENQGYPDYDGFAWYRQQVVIPAEWQSSIKKYGGVIVRYDNADDADELFVNGKSVGATGDFPPSYKSRYGQKRKYIVTPEHLVFDKPNTIAVRVYDGVGGGGLLTAQTTIRPMQAADALQIAYSFPAKEWVFMDGEPQQVDLTLRNASSGKAKCNVIFVLKTDKRAAVDSVVTPVQLSAGEEKAATVAFKLPEPGFYRCTLYAESNGVAGDMETFNVGYEPEKIVSPRDAKPDLEAFWAATRAELDKVAPGYKLTLIPERSTGAKNIYHVEMSSFGNVRIEGYYAEPKAKGVYPAIAVYMGYGSEPYFPHTDGNPGYAEFILSVRGQGIQKAKSAYGDWIVWGLESKETYYYRGAFMDLVRAVDFLASRPKVDKEKIVAEGGSQGGAFTLAACALDSRIRAGAPTIPFLSDYRDYFEIVGWPRSSFEAYLNEHPNRTWDEVYDVLSYFDIKNLSGWIRCPIVMAAGLQDEVCPPHTNFAGYNLISSEKQYRIYHDQGHGTPAEWQDVRTKFFNDQTK
ncbi:MAG: acetylxylan esterase [Prevotellaceae bacterium]|jgi:cephalosporin-C deacetylase-like acetyl esterase|nr:acetylxylan esterase [Prevotellaceae bacterium]